MIKESFYIITFGCQMNERDSETLAGIMEESGYEEAVGFEDADITVLNTCSVRENADKRFYGVLGRLKNLKKQNPKKIIALCGCMMQQAHIREAVRKSYPWVDIIFGPLNIEEFPRLLDEAKKRLEEKEKNGKPLPHKITESIREEAREIAEGLPAARSSAFKAYVNITCGCDNFCTYCIVPYTRGRERSRRPEMILAECEGLAKKGVKEIMLLGQNVNSYGKSKSPYSGYRVEGTLDFAGLIREVDKIKGIERIRFMTSHPKDISDDLISCFGECSHLCKVLHLPVQSGSNEVLRKMNRRYTRERYLEIVEKLRKAAPDIAITTDIIVGFPGESEDDFEDTLDLVRRVRYDSAFMFIYSPRNGTPAASFPEQIPPDVSHKRFLRLEKTVHGIQEEKNKMFENKVLPVLVEGRSKKRKDVLTGRTESGVTVDFKGPESLMGNIVPVRIVKAQTFSFYGELL